MSTRTTFRRDLDLSGWERSAWGYDDVYECYWAELRASGGGAVRIGPERLLVTLGGLAGALASAAGCQDQEVYLALTA